MCVEQAFKVKIHYMRPEITQLCENSCDKNAFKSKAYHPHNT